MADHKLQIILAAKDITGTALTRFKGNLGAITRSVFSLQTALATLGGTTGLGLLAKSSIDAASALEEATSKFNVVFGDQTARADEWVKALVDVYGESTVAARKYLAEMQDLLVPIGLNANAAAELSNEVVKLAEDLASFNNLNTKDVMRDMQSAMVGNFETMKKYGVVLNETVVKQRALDLGLIKSKNEINAVAKAQAAWSIILDSTKAAQGDAIRTAGSYANQVRRLKNGLEDTAAAIGTALLPNATELVTSLNDWIKANDKLLSQDIPKYIDNVGRSIGTVVDVYKSLPADIVGAAGAGIVGRILFGTWTPAKIIGVLAIINEGLKKFGMDVRSTVDDFRQLSEAVNNIWEQLTGGKAQKPIVIRRKIEMPTETAAPSTTLPKPSAKPQPKKITPDYSFLDRSDGAYRMSRAGGVVGEFGNVIEAQKRALENLKAATVDGYDDMTAHVDAYYDNIEEQNRRVTEGINYMADSMSSAIAGFVTTGKFSFKDFADSVINDLIRIQTRTLLTNIFTQQAGGSGVLSNIFSAFASNAKGGVYDRRGAAAFARGGVVDRPTMFPFAGGVGLMGEAGPEAILPLGRTGSGELGVKTTGGSSPVVVNNYNYYNIQALDAPDVVRLMRRSGAVPILAAEDIGGNGPLRAAIMENL